MNDISLAILFGILVVLLCISAFFSGSETALMTLNRYRLKHLVKQKHKGAIKVHKLLQRPDRLMGLILLGNNFVNILAASLTTIIALRIGGKEIIAIGTGLLTLVILIFSEVTPKTLAALKPELLAYSAAWIYTPLLKLFYPLIWLINLLANLLLRIVGIEVEKNKQETINKEELKAIVSDAKNLMPARYQKMLLGVLDLESASVEDIMVPQNEIVGIDLEKPIELIYQQILNSTHTRLPIYKKNVNHIIGFLHLRTVIALISRNELDKQRITEHLTKPFFIPESTPLHNQIHSFKAEKLRIGLVIDEYGDVQGLVTLDDLLQVLVGKLVAEEIDVKEQKDGSYLVDGSITIRELNQITAWSLPIKGPKTLNGLIIDYMETIPAPGTSIRLHGYALEVIKCDNNAIKLVKFYPQK